MWIHVYLAQFEHFVMYTKFQLGGHTAKTCVSFWHLFDQTFTDEPCSFSACQFCMTKKRNTFL